MASYKMQTKIYNRPCIVDEQKVFSEILLCEKFGWSWCEFKTGVHHTAIVFYLDYEARFTVNWSPKNGSKNKSIATEIEGQLTYEDERLKNPDQVEYMPCLEEYDVVSILHAEDDTLLDDLFNLVRKLSSFRFYKYDNVGASGNARNYDLSSCNCRDHVEAVLRDVLPCGGEDLRRALNALKRIRWERIPEKILYGVAKVRGFFSLILSVILPVLPVLNIIDIEKALAKYVGPDSEILTRARRILRQFRSFCLLA